MFAIADLIRRQTDTWAREQRDSMSSLCGAVLRHIDHAKKLRQPQIKAIETYLWLKFEGDNKPLAEIVISGKLTDKRLAEEYKYTPHLDNYSPANQFFIAFAKDNGLQPLEREARDNPNIDWEGNLKILLGTFPYPNRVFSLPMGAGKTYLMAAFIYLDLHFSRLLPSDKRFAHNFVIFAPHASKTAILPSLKTVKMFEPEWVLPPAAAADIAREVRVEILDQAAAAKRSMRVNNPNLEKVNRLSQTHKRGLIFITNAEKVVLEKYTEDKWLEGLGREQKTKAEKSNALRDCMAEIPHLSVFLDEVHHAESSDKKLRQAVEVLNSKGNLLEVSGFSGTPYTKGNIEINGRPIRYQQLQDVVYHFPLAVGIGNFLKKPKVKKHEGISETVFVHSVLSDFFNDYDITYAGGEKSKIAFYCASIAALNETILPAVHDWYTKNRSGKENELLSYYTKSTDSAKKYPLAADALAQFHALDSPHSDKRVVLLVAVGKEGWDCRSLTAVAIPRKGDSGKTAKNFVLQASCRCLREVTNAGEEKALICLGGGNYATLEKELKEIHNLSIMNFEKGGDGLSVLVRKPNLGKLRYQQITHKWTVESEHSDFSPAAELKKFQIESFKKRHDYTPLKQTGIITSKGKIGSVVRVEESQAAPNFLSPIDTENSFLCRLQIAVWNRLTAAELSQNHGEQLTRIYKQFSKNEEWFAAHPQDGREMTFAALREVAACFAGAREYRSETLHEDIEIDLLEWQGENNNIAWGGGNFLPEVPQSQSARYRTNPHRLEEDLEEDKTDPQDISFNYAPYRFDSNFEKNAILSMLKEAAISGFELYYNGYTHSNLQSFYINTPGGRYTPDFLLIRRHDGKPYRKGKPSAAAIERILIIETKGAIYDDATFKGKENFVKKIFIKNNPHFRYIKFTDTTGNDDFQTHLQFFREAVQEWATNGDNKR